MEIVCADPVEHRRRVETRVSDIPGHVLPGWDEVTARTYHAWDRDHLTIDTSARSDTDCVELLLRALQTQ